MSWNLRVTILCSNNVADSVKSYSWKGKGFRNILVHMTLLNILKQATIGPSFRSRIVQREEKLASAREYLFTTRTHARKAYARQKILLRFGVNIRVF